MSPRTFLQPPDWAAARGYANGIAVSLNANSQLIFVGGQIGWNKDQQFESDDFIAQCSQALRNVLHILQQSGAGAEHMTRMTWYITDRDEYNARLKELGVVYKAVMGKNFPAMSCVEVSRLVEPLAKVEIEVTAVK